MEAETRKRKPLADRTNTTRSSLSLHKPSSLPTTTNSTPTQPSDIINHNNNKKPRLTDTNSLVETRSRRNRKDADKAAARRSIPNTAAADDDGHNKENIPADPNILISTDVFQDDSVSSPSTPAVHQPLSPLAEPLTVYARRQTAKNKGKEKVIDEAFTCPQPVKRKRNESGKQNFAKISKCLTEFPKKRLKKEHVVLNDYFEQQRAYFAEIDKCELPEEEVSENELSDR